MGTYGHEYWKVYVWFSKRVVNLNDKYELYFA